MGVLDVGARGSDYDSLLARRLAMAGRNGRTGMVLAVVAETVFFVSLIFLTLSVRRTATMWPPAGSPTLDVALLWRTSAALLLSMGTMGLAIRMIRRDRRIAMTGYVLLSSVLGALFVWGQWAQFQHIGGWQTGEGSFSVLFNIISGFHALHVSIGLGLMLVLMFRATLGQFDAERHVFVSVTATWWTFVCAIWLPLLAVVALV